MKKLFLILLIAFIGLGATAQSSNMKIADSTLTNAQTAHFYRTITGPKTAVTFVYAASNTSGTTASVITLYGSTDGTNYVALATDTVTATGNFARSYNYNGYAKYRVSVVQTGTSVTNYKIFSLYR